MPKILIFRVISIHAPLAGSDSIVTSGPFWGADFNPRSPCGERLEGANGPLHLQIFQSTLPLRGATLVLILLVMCLKFQSTLPLRGATAKTAKKCSYSFPKLNNLRKYHHGFLFLGKSTVSFFCKFVQKHSAKLPVFPVCLPFASKQSAHPQDHRRTWSQNARFCFHSGFQDSKTAGCPSPSP